MGIGDWGLGIGPNPQSPIPNPQSPIILSYFILLEYVFLLYLSQLIILLHSNGLHP